MGGSFEGDKRGLPHDRGIDIVQLVDEQALLYGSIGFGGHQGIGENPFAEDRGRFRQRQRGVEGEDIVLLGHHGVDGMT